MKNVLVIGSTGQIGSELTLKLREHLSGDRVVAGYIPGSEPHGALLESGPCAQADVLDAPGIAALIDRYHIDTVYNLAALLSAIAETKPLMAWNIQVNGVLNLLEIAREKGCAVFTPSSIGAFGPGTPSVGTPQDTIQRPRSIYGVSKVAIELLADYYFSKYGVDTRSVRFPGLISYMTPPGGGTTDYAVDIYRAAAGGEDFACPLRAGTFLDMMYMPDALEAAIRLMEADPSRLKHRNSFNITAMSLDPEILFHQIRRHIPDFRMYYAVDPVKQAIADSWPDRMDDTCAREEWDWAPAYDLKRMTAEMLSALGERCNNPGRFV